MNYYERNAIERINEITDNSELRRHLLSVEILIKELVGDDPYLFYSSRAQNYEKFERVESLIELRLLILNKIFGATDNEVHRFENAVGKIVGGEEAPKRCCECLHDIAS